MAQILLDENTVNTKGDLPHPGDAAPDFKLTNKDLSDISLKEFEGKKVVMNIFPSIDMSVCAASVRKFNAEISNQKDAALLCVSRDLPFAHARFCGAEGIKNVIPASDMRDTSFGNAYGVTMMDGPLKGLFARAVVVIDENKKVIYSQLVPDISQEPDYEKAIAALSEKSEELSDDVCVVSETAEHYRTDSFDDPCDDGRAG